MEEPAQLLVMIEGAIADPYRVVLPITHVAGASDPTEQPNAPSVTFDWLGPLTFDFAGAPTPLSVGNRVGLVLDQAGGGIWSDIWDDLWSPALPAGTAPIPITQRFSGRITDIEAAADTETLRSKITCVGISAEAASFQVGRTARPAETETARVAAWNAQAPTYAIVNNAGTTNLVARAAESAGLLDALQQTAESTGARVFEDGLGQIQYVGLAARKAATLGVHLDELQVLAPVGWAQHVAGLLNDVTVFYGDPAVAPATERASVNVQDGPSISQFGRQTVTIETELTTDDDAITFGNIVLAHWSKAFWDAPLIAVPAHLLDAATWAALMTMKLGQIVETEGVVSVPSTPAGVGRWLLEGFSQTWDRDETGGLTDYLQLAVSELERWIADGKTDSFVTATATPSSAPYLSPISIAATVKANGLPIPAGGVVEVYDGTTLLGSGATVGTTGVATISVKPPVGSRHLSVKFVGNVSYRPSSTIVNVTVTPVTSTAVAIAVDDTSVRRGDPVKLTATVTPVGVTGSIRWELDRHDGAGWVDWTGHDSPVSPTTGKATATWETSSTPVVTWRARFIPSSTDVAGATSGTVTVNVAQPTTQTITYPASWGATYQQDGDKRSDTSDLYQGYYSGTNGNQRSIAGGFGISGWSGAEITKVEVWLDTPHWQSASGGTAVIGSSTAASEPASWPSSGIVDDRTRAAFERGEGRWVNITSWGEGFATGSLRAIVLGPGPSTSGTFYGYATGTGSDRPKIRITGTVWS